jgi:hypothetical protein
MYFLEEQTKTKLESTTTMLSLYSTETICKYKQWSHRDESESTTTGESDSGNEPQLGEQS